MTSTNQLRQSSITNNPSLILEKQKEKTADQISQILKSVKVTPLGGIGSTIKNLSGSANLVEITWENGKTFKILIDYGSYLGNGKELDRELNLESYFDNDEIDFVINTHPHLDHSGRLPRLIVGDKKFKGKILTHKRALNLLSIISHNSAYIIKKEHKTKTEEKKKALKDNHLIAELSKKVSKNKIAKNGKKYLPESILPTLEFLDKIYNKLNRHITELSKGKKLKLQILKDVIHWARNFQKSGKIEKRYHTYKMLNETITLLNILLDDPNSFNQIETIKYLKSINTHILSALKKMRKLANKNQAQNREIGQHQDAIAQLEDYQKDLKKRIENFDEDHKEEIEEEGRLYTEEDVRKILSKEFIEGLDYNQTVELANGVKLTLFDSGHTIGSSQVLLQIDKGINESVNLGFSGDLGRYKEPLLDNKPKPIPAQLDFYMCESTYGDRIHPPRHKEWEIMSDSMLETYRKGGKILSPCFMLQRQQDVDLVIETIINKNIEIANKKIKIINDLFEQFRLYLDNINKDFDIQEFETIFDDFIDTQIYQFDGDKEMILVKQDIKRIFKIFFLIKDRLQDTFYKHCQKWYPGQTIDLNISNKENKFNIKDKCTRILRKIFKDYIKHDKNKKEFIENFAEEILINSNFKFTNDSKFDYIKFLKYLNLSFENNYEFLEIIDTALSSTYNGEIDLRKDIEIHFDGANSGKIIDLFKLAHPKYLKALSNIKSQVNNGKHNQFLNLKKMAIMLASSGMCNGGPVMKYLVSMLENPKCTIWIVGFQGKGTLGRKIQKYAGRKNASIYIHPYGDIPIKAKIINFKTFSSHGDQPDIHAHLKKNLKFKPKASLVFNHGEVISQSAMIQSVKTQQVVNKNVKLIKAVLNKSIKVYEKS